MAASSAHRRLAILSSHLVPSGNSHYGTLQANATSSSAAARLLEGQVAIVTGSGQGIGASTAKLFAQQGAKVVVTDLDAGTNLLFCDLLSMLYYHHFFVL